jgi:hypothetical protein
MQAKYNETKDCNSFVTHYVTHSCSMSTTGSSLPWQPAISNCQLHISNKRTPWPLVRKRTIPTERITNLSKICIWTVATGIYGRVMIADCQPSRTKPHSPFGTFGGPLLHLERGEQPFCGDDGLSTKRKTFRLQSYREHSEKWGLVFWVDPNVTRVESSIDKRLHVLPTTECKSNWRITQVAYLLAPVGYFCTS